MDEWPSEEELKKNREELIASLKSGAYTFLDGIMSVQTLELVSNFGTSDVDMTSLWAMTPQDWTCPACGRQKTQIARPNKNNHLMCRLVEHHDHMQELLKQKFEEISTSLSVVVADQMSEAFAKRSSTMISSFDNTVICDDCNVADINAKKASGANRWFSFSPAELKEIIVPRNNLPHTIDREIAVAHWKNNEATFNLRLKIAHRIAEIAATDNHWFQPVNFNYHPRVIKDRARDIINRKRAYGIIDLLIGSKQQEKPANSSGWRRKHYPAKTSTPTASQIEHAAKVKAQKQWSTIGDDWVCEGCGRNKEQIVKVTKKNGWGFSLSSRWYRDASKRNNMGHYTLCSDCGFVAERLGQEARLVADRPNGPLSCLVEVGEISKVVIPRPNARHNINNIAADKVVEEIVERLLNGEECGWALYSEDGHG